jgi:hypothetical protein
LLPIACGLAFGRSTAVFEKREALTTLPTPPALAVVVLLLEQLKQELQQDPKWQMLCKLMGPTQADSKFQPVKGIQEALRTVSGLQYALAFPAQLTSACDLTSLWLALACQNLVLSPEDTGSEEQGDARGLLQVQAGASPIQGWGQLECENLRTSWALENSGTGIIKQPLSSQQSTAESVAGFTSLPSLLLMKGSQHIDSMSADTPLAVLHIWWDAWRTLSGAPGQVGLLSRINKEMEASVELYLGCVSELAYEHFKVRPPSTNLITSSNCLICLENCTASAVKTHPNVGVIWQAYYLSIRVDPGSVLLVQHVCLNWS